MTVIGPFFGSQPNQLQKDGTISFSRGVIKILDRSRLEALSCECYQSLIDQSATLGRYSAPTGAPPQWRLACDRRRSHDTSPPSLTGRRS